MQRSTFPFVAIIGVGLFIVACGRQVTPNPPGLGAGGAPPGYLALHFDVAGPFNFSSYQYMFVFNTSGSGVTPSTDTLQTNWNGYNFALVARGNGVSSLAQVVEFATPKAGKGPPGWVAPGTTPQQFSYNLNDNGTGTEFSMLVQNSILAGFASPSPGPSTSPTPTPPSTLTFNAFTTQPGASQGQWFFLDSLGVGGPTDPQFVSPTLCLTEPFQYTKYGSSQNVSDPAAQIVSVTIANNPIAPKPCP